eukprot:1315052-Amorphochlora_amoeboformis.AAC.2
MATQAFAMEVSSKKAPGSNVWAYRAVKRKATGRDAVGVGTAVAATKAELKAQLLNSNNDEVGSISRPLLLTSRALAEATVDTKEEMEKAKQVSCWDAWKFRLMFFIGAGLGAAFIGTLPEEFGGDGCLTLIPFPRGFPGQE